MKNLSSEFLSAAMLADAQRRRFALRVLKGEVPLEAGSVAHTPVLLTLSEAARLAGISRTTLYKCFKIGSITPVEIAPGLRRVPRVAITRLAEAHNGTSPDLRPHGGVAK